MASTLRPIPGWIRASALGLALVAGSGANAQGQGVFPRSGGWGRASEIGGESAGDAKPELADRDNVAAALATLLDHGASESTRSEAARTLAGACWTEAGRLAALGVLRGPESGTSSSAGLLLRALSREATLPEWLLPVLTDMAGSVEGDRLSRVLTSAGAIRTPDALRLVARFLDPGIADSARSAAQSSLVRATGRDDIAASPQAWLDWIDGVVAGEAAGGESWRSVLLRGVAERADRLSTRAREVASRLVETQRRLYLSGEASQRGVALAGLISDDLADIRGLGFELLERELASAPQPAAEVVSALMTLLGHQTPAVRAQAATFIGRIAPEGAGEAVARALLRETDAVAAMALLTASARWPRAEIGPAVLRWLEHGMPTRPVAASTALAMHRSGLWTPEDLARIVSVMRRVPWGDLGPASCRLIAAVGTDEDRRGLSTLLISGTPAQRLAIAEALAPRAEYLDSIVAAASRDSALMATAARGVAEHRPTIDGFRAIARLNGPDDQAKRAALRTVGEVLGTGALLSAADETGGDGVTTQWLLERARAQAQQAVIAGDPRGADLLNEATERLARLHLELGRPAEAIAAMDAVPAGPTDTRFNRLRTMALVMLGRLDDADDLGEGVETWLSALERCVSMAHGRAVADLIQAQFGAGLTEAQAERLASLRARTTEPVPRSVSNPG